MEMPSRYNISQYMYIYIYIYNYCSIGKVYSLGYTEIPKEFFTPLTRAVKSAGWCTDNHGSKELWT
jgi:hypothetical protein